MLSWRGCYNPNIPEKRSVSIVGNWKRYEFSWFEPNYTSVYYVVINTTHLV